MVDWNECAKVANLVMVLMIAILSLNRMAWSILLTYDPLNWAKMTMTFHLATFGTITFLIHILDQCIRELLTPSSNSYCLWNFKMGGVLLAVSYFSVWIFYWQRHRVLRRKHNIRLLSNVGLALITFCFIALCTIYLVFFGGKLGKDGSCVITKQFSIGSWTYNTAFLFWVTIWMDIICTGYLCCVFLVPLFKLLDSLGEALIETQTMKSALQRTAWAAVLASLSTTTTIILVRGASIWNSTFDEEMCFVNIDQLLTTFSIHISLAPRNRWFWSWFKSRKTFYKQEIQF